MHPFIVSILSKEIRSTLHPAVEGQSGSESEIREKEGRPAYRGKLAKIMGGMLSLSFLSAGSAELHCRGLAVGRAAAPERPFAVA